MTRNFIKLRSPTVPLIDTSRVIATEILLSDSVSPHYLEIPRPSIIVHFPEMFIIVNYTDSGLAVKDYTRLTSILDPDSIKIPKINTETEV